ncbi:MAG: hypothetical protein HY360_13735 [Verrucomicrobia bacterium]|nr:hypothetical protein [Verrucomicrobiota bacterium]
MNGNQGRLVEREREGWGADASRVFKIGVPPIFPTKAVWRDASQNTRDACAPPIGTVLTENQKWRMSLGIAMALPFLSSLFYFERQRTVMGAWISHVIADLGIMTIGYKILMLTRLANGGDAFP